MKEVAIARGVLAPHTKPHRETSCTQSSTDANHAAHCSKAHAIDDKRPEYATSPLRATHMRARPTHVDDSLTKHQSIHFSLIGGRDAPPGTHFEHSSSVAAPQTLHCAGSVASVLVGAALKERLLAMACSVCRRAWPSAIARQLGQCTQPSDSPSRATHSQRRGLRAVLASILGKAKICDCECFSGGATCRPPPGTGTATTRHRHTHSKRTMAVTGLVTRLWSCNG